MILKLFMFLSVFSSLQSLLLMITDEPPRCFFTHVDESTKRYIESCHWDYLQMEIRQAVEWADESMLRKSSLEVMREQYHDVLADFRCIDKEIYQLDHIFGSDFIGQCAAMVGK